MSWDMRSLTCGNKTRIPPLNCHTALFFSTVVQPIHELHWPKIKHPPMERSGCGSEFSVIFEYEARKSISKTVKTLRFASRLNWNFREFTEGLDIAGENYIEFVTYVALTIEKV
jgi:hypothetical protein